MKTEEPKPRIHLNDIKDGVEMRETPIFIVGDQKFWADRTTKDKLATHADCKICGTEFEKQYYYTRSCSDCDLKTDMEDFLKLPLVEWDGKIPLALWGGDTYFFDISDLISHCEDNDVKVEDLKLVTCCPTKFTTINVSEVNEENVHEDWEPEAELCRLEEALNNYLEKASTRTWLHDDKRVFIKTEDLK